MRASGVECPIAPNPRRVSSRGLPSPARHRWSHAIGTSPVNEPSAAFSSVHPLAALAAWWGIAGVFTILAYAIVRLTPIALEALQSSLSWYHWLAMISNVLFMAYSEGYRGFQCSFSPRVAARAASLRDHPTPIRVLLAPLYCAGYFGATRRVQITAFAIVAGVIALVQLVHYLDQPWRGILDAGVVVGLGWGAAATVVLGIGALRTGNPAPSEAPDAKMDG